MMIARGLVGLCFFCLVAWGISSDRKKFPWRIVVFGLAMQAVLGGLILGTSLGYQFFESLSGVVQKLIGMAQQGAVLVFGPLADPAAMAEAVGTKQAFIFAFAGRGLVAIIFFSALMAVLYHMGVMQLLVYALARVMTVVLGVSGAESMAMAANVFVGQTEAPLVVRPYIDKMTQSELNALMTGGFATIAGSVLAVYIGVIGEDYGPHLLAASVMSAPAAFLVAKIMLPEQEESVTRGAVAFRIERTANNLVEAAANGTTDGLKLWLNVIAMLIAFTGLVALINWPLEAIGESSWGAGFPLLKGLSLQKIFGWVFSPVAWMMGVEGAHDCQLFGGLLGTKVSVNEFVAFTELQSALATETGQGGFEHTRSAQMAAYALCGFANFASIGIQIGGITPLAPSRKSDLARLAPRAMLGGAMASWMTATMAGMFL